MFNSSVLEVVIGLVFIFLLYSLLATIIQEMVASAFAFRSKILERAIFKMLEDENKFSSRISSIFYLFKRTGNGGEIDSTSFEFYNHPLIKFLGENKSNSRPSYITRETFSKVLIDLLRGDKVKPGDDINSLIQKALDENVTNWGKSEISKETLSYLRSMWVDAQGDVDKFKGYLENWFDETMDRASGWYKKNTQFILFFIGLTIAIVFNVDAIKIAGKLEKDPKLREQIVQQADVFVKAHPDLSKDIADQKASMENLLFEIERNRNTPKGDSLIRVEKQESYELIKTKELRAKREALLKQADSLVKTDIGKSNEVLGLGWNSHRSNPRDFQGFLLAMLGWIITAMALSLGAPFWFDMLNKVMKVRNSVANATQEEKPDKQKQ